MVVLDGEDFDGVDLAPIEPAIRFAGNRVIGRQENQAVGVIEIAGELTVAIPGQLVIPGLRKVPHIFEGFGCAEFFEPTFEFVGPKRSQLFLGVFSLICAFAEFAVPESNLHFSTKCKDFVNLFG